ncbi:MAG TPA: hypothetical protein VKB86_16485 [Pyrinomonadaceae bacterium]|nr:hypothetical protein [Pyrinomonadaceae bacterium]
MLRAAALSLLILVSIALTLPLVDSSAHNSGRAATRHSHMRHHHSRAWWRRYRARLRRERAAMKRKQSLDEARGQKSMNAAEADSHNSNHIVYLQPSVVNDIKTDALKSSSSASALSLPMGWIRRTASANGETKFVISAEDGQYIGAATLSVVANARPSGETFLTARTGRRTLGGVSVTELRRTVIDKMISSNGWVVNDITREIGGKPAFIVLAQTAASTDGRTPQLSWVFLFTEVDGRIYSLAASSLSEFSDRIADDSAQLMTSFLANSRSTLQAGR